MYFVSSRLILPLSFRHPIPCFSPPSHMKVLGAGAARLSRARGARATK